MYFILAYLRKSFFFLSVLFTCITGSICSGQQLNLPLNNDWNWVFQKNLQKVSNPAFTSIRPYNSVQLSQTYNYDSLIFTKYSEGWLKRKFTKESFIVVDTQNFKLAIDPLLNLEIGKDMEDSTGEKFYKNTRGLLVRGNIGNNFSFESSFYENQAKFPAYITNYIFVSDNVVPGQGRAKSFKKTVYDFAMASGYISYSPIKQLNLQAGHGKHFIGNGYRSLLLSDNSFNYPYLKAQLTFSKFSYTALYSSLMILKGGGIRTSPFLEPFFRKKTATFHYLSWKPIKRIEVSLFEATIWDVPITTEPKIQLNSLNPLLFSSLIQNGLDTKNNVLLGADFSVKVCNYLMVYGQFMADNIDLKKTTSFNNKTGYQAGFRLFDLLKIKNLNVQGEFNTIRPYAYAHRKPFQSYTHYNQPLAHTLGANFKEVLGFINYRYKRIFVQGRYSLAEIGTDSSESHWGQNIFLPDHLAEYTATSTINQTGQGLKAKISHQDFYLSYILNPVTRLNMVVGISNRIQKIQGQNSATQYFYLGLRTSFTNIYYDF